MDHRAALKFPGIFEHTVSALVYTLASAQVVRGDAEEMPPYNDVTAFVLEQWARMPRFLAWPLQTATVMFGFSAMRHGALFHRLRPARRAIQVETWSASRIGPCRDLMRFYRSLALLGLYSRGAEGAGCRKTFSARR